jgi:hypothetical protein
VRELNKRENQNILKLKLNKMVELESFTVKNMRKVVLLKALNFPSPRSTSFITPVKREGSTNPFLKLLNSPSRNVEILQGSS